MPAPPSRNNLAGTGGSAPSNATARVGFGAFWDYVTSLLGLTGSPVDAREALGVGTKGHQFGCQLTLPAASTTMSISAGEWQDSTGAYLMSISAMTKTTSAWASGTGNGGRLGAAAVANNTWYDWYLIYNPTTGATEIGFDLPGVVTYPSGYTASRRIFSALTNGSGQWLPCIQDGDYFQWLNRVADVSATNPGTAAVNRTLTVPTGVSVIAEIQVGVTNTGSGGISYSAFSDLSTTAPTPGTGASDTTAAASAAGAAVSSGAVRKVRTTTAAQIRSQLSYSDATVFLNIQTIGWFDTRGRNA